MLFRTLLVVACAYSVAISAQAADLRGHRAEYRLIPGELADEFQSVSGLMTVEMRDTCTAWTMVQDTQIDGTLRDGNTETTIRHKETTETHDHLSFDFSNSVAMLAGTSTLTGRMVRDRVSSPWQLRFIWKRLGVTHPERFLQMPFDTLPPVFYIHTLIGALGEGKTVFNALLYSGVSMAPLEYLSRAQDARPLPPIPELAGIRSWVVEQLVVSRQREPHSVTRQIAENGVVARIRETTQFGVLNWELTELTLLPKDCSTR